MPNSRKLILVRTAFEKFSGAWLACILVMSKGDLAAAFGTDHIRAASVCGLVSGLVAAALVSQMELSTDSAARQAIIAAITAFLGDVYSRSSQFSPHWPEPSITALIAAVIALAIWYGKSWLRSSTSVFP